MCGSLRANRRERRRVNSMPYPLLSSLRSAGSSSGTSVSCSRNIAQGSMSTRRDSQPAGRVVSDVGISASVYRPLRVLLVPFVARCFGAMSSLPPVLPQGDRHGV
jgi:hypothetical protein